MASLSEDQVKNALDILAEEVIDTARTRCVLYPNENWFFDFSYFVYYLVREMNLECLNVVLWASNLPNLEKTIEGPWKFDKYCENEGPMLQKLRTIAESLNLPGDNVLFVIPKDNNKQDKIAQFIANFTCQLQTNYFYSLLWFECLDVDALNIFNV
jgi:hypothetical protein